MTTPSVTAAYLEKRRRLAELLREAAQLEHGVMCQYLFAAVSMKKMHDEGGVSWDDLERMRVWRAQIMTVARQEMEHLAIVSNLLTAIGEAPVLERRDFPYAVNYAGVDLNLTLEPFGTETIRRFALIEMPEKLQPNSLGWKLLAQNDPTFSPSHFDLIARLYDEVESLISEIPEAILFIGPPAAQFVTHEIFPGKIRGIDLSGAPAYNISLTAIVNRASALAGVQQIQEEGEGATDEGDAQSHFAVFISILQDLLTNAYPGFAPARPTLSNPKSSGQGDSVVTRASTLAVMELFDACYETLIVALMRYFAHTDENEADLIALQQASFFPMMTTVIRPLAECLTVLPAHEAGTATAGPSFTLARGLQFPPHRDAALQLILFLYDGLVERSQALSQQAADPNGPPELRPLADRLTQIYETLWRSRLNFAKAAGLKDANV